MPRALMMLLVAAVIILTLVLWLGHAPIGASGHQRMSPDAFAARLAEPDTWVLDVHVPHEGQIPGTVARIPFDQVAMRAAELPTDLSTPIAVYCMSGSMSAVAAETLVGLGYRNVIELEGGMIAWKAAGYELWPN